MKERGELATYPGRVTPAGEFLKDCAARLQGSRIVAAGADRYRRRPKSSKPYLRPNRVWDGVMALARHRGHARRPTARMMSDHSSAE